MITADQIKAAYSGYQGWNDNASIVANYLQTGGEGKGNTPYALGTGNSATISANNIQAPVDVPYTSGAQESYLTGIASDLAKAKQSLQDSLTSQQTTVDAKLAAAKAKETTITDNIGTLSTPFRSDLETTQRDALYINQNFEENQKLVDELDSLLTEGNALIAQQKSVTGLTSVRNPRIQKTMDDVTARAGVIQAVMAARNSQITVAENLIDRSANAIAADRQDQIDYWKTLLELNNRDIVSLDSQSQTLAQEQLKIKEGEVSTLQDTVTKIKDLMIDPATASLVASAGVTLNDSVDTINAKMAKAVYVKEVQDQSNEITKAGGVAVTSPAGIPAAQLRSFIDSKGVTHYYKMPVTTTQTATEKSVASVASTISANKINFPDAVVKFANQMTLSEIYQAYNASDMGKQYGLPTESSNEISLLYQWATGKITEQQYRDAVNSTQ